MLAGKQGRYTVRAAASGRPRPMVFVVASGCTVKLKLASVSRLPFSFSAYAVRGGVAVRLCWGEEEAQVIGCGVGSSVTH